MAENRKIPVREGLWTEPASVSEKPQLIGSRCLSCGEVFFPTKRVCVNCQSTKLEQLGLSRFGKIYSYSVVMQSPAGPYGGPVPYAIGYVELPEGVRVETLFTDCHLDALRTDMNVEMVIEKLHIDNEGNEVLAYKFRPTQE